MLHNALIFFQGALNRYCAY